MSRPAPHTQPAHSATLIAILVFLLALFIAWVFLFAQPASGH